MRYEFCGSRTSSLFPRPIRSDTVALSEGQAVMQLVEFEQHEGQKIWLNPAQILMLHAGTALTQTDVYLPDIGMKTVKGTVAEVAEKLNKGLKT